MEWQKIFNSFLEYVKLKTAPLLEENADLSVIGCTMHKYSDNDKNYSYRTEAVIALLFSDVHDDHHKKLIETALLAEMRYCYMAWGCSNSLRILAGLLWNYDKESPLLKKAKETNFDTYFEIDDDCSELLEAIRNLRKSPSLEQILDLVCYTENEKFYSQLLDIWIDEHKENLGQSELYEWKFYEQFRKNYENRIFIGEKLVGIFKQENNKYMVDLFLEYVINTHLESGDYEKALEATRRLIAEQSKSVDTDISSVLLKVLNTLPLGQTKDIQVFLLSYMPHNLNDLSLATLEAGIEFAEKLNDYPLKQRLTRRRNKNFTGKGIHQR